MCLGLCWSVVPHRREVKKFKRLFAADLGFDMVDSNLELPGRKENLMLGSGSLRADSSR